MIGIGIAAISFSSDCNLMAYSTFPRMENEISSTVTSPSGFCKSSLMAAFPSSQSSGVGVHESPCKAGRTSLTLDVADTSTSSSSTVATENSGFSQYTAEIYEQLIVWSVDSQSPIPYMR